MRPYLGIVSLAAPLLLVTGCSDGGGGGMGGPDGGPVDGAGGGMDQGETGRQVGMTAAHNEVRASVGEGLPPLQWDPELADVAKSWSEQLANDGCAFRHSDNQYGENLAFFGGGGASPEEVVQLWASERECYSFGEFMRTDECSSSGQCNGSCGHYTQIVWRETERLGCGVATCDNGREIWTCNYDPPGNFIGREPY